MDWPGVTRGDLKCEVALLLNAVPEAAEFVLSATDGALSPAGLLPEITGSRFSVTSGGQSRTLRRTWLDTFDWRLFRAGLNLECTAARGTSELVLTARDGELIAVQGTSRAGGPLRWPARIEQLPLGPLREQIASVVGVRALLAVVRATSAQTRRRALNADDKTIATLTTDQLTLTQPARVAIQARVSVSPLRGYQAQAAKLADALSQAPGVARADQSVFDAAMRAAGRRPGDYTSKIDVRLTADMPAALAVCTVLTRLFGTAQANIPGTIRDIDTEFLHDLRIAVRRTRSVLKLAGSVLPASLPDRYRPEFKWLGDLTTPTRDLDVYLLGYPAMAAGLSPRPSRSCGPSTTISPGSGPRPSDSWPGDCARPGSPRWPGPGGATWSRSQRRQAGVRPPGGSRQSGSRVRIRTRCALAAPSTPPLPAGPARPAQALQGTALPA